MRAKDQKTWEEFYEEFYRAEMEAVFCEGVKCPGCAFPGLAHWPSCGNQNVFAAPVVTQSDDFPPCGGAGG